MAQQKLAGVVAMFEGPDALVEAMKKVRAANYRSIDAFTPFPVHGMDDAQGLKRSPIPWVTFCAGITGTSVAFGLQYWTSAVDWPLIVGGKPFNSWPAFVPVMFELTVLFAGISTLLALVFFCRLPNTARKVVDSGITRDKFALWVEAPGDASDELLEAGGKFKRFDGDEVQRFMQGLGAREVRKVYAEGWF